MSDCCSSNKANLSFPRKQTCPINGQDYIRVPVKTILHHINEPWNVKLKKQGYYFCADPNCEVVYFGEDGTQIKKFDLRTKVGIKEKDGESIICYCFGVSKSAAKQDLLIKDFVVQQTKQHLCACDARNPSGRCCLKDFPNKQ